MANQRKDVPPGWTWRDGRPRWVPSPTLRKAGWKGHDLKDKRGQWLGRGPSIEAADAIAAAVNGWRAGHLVPAALAPHAPAGAAEKGGAGRTAPGDRLSIGALMSAYVGDAKAQPPIPPAPEFAALAASTQRDYRGKLKRLVDVLAGYVSPPESGPKSRPGSNAFADYEAKVAKVRAASIFALEPREDVTGMVDLLHRAYWKFHAEVGKHQAHGVLSVTSAWLAWCRERQSRTIHNWAAEIKRETPPGRIRVATWDELKALVRMADAMGKHGVADAMILAVDLGWSEVDVLNLTWDRVRDGRALTGADGRQKTGRVGGTPFLSIGLERLKVIRARQAALTVSPLKVVHLPRQRAHARRKPGADGDFLRKQFAEVRAAVVAKGMASVADLTFADLRDTAFTLGREAGLTDDMTVSRSLQSRKNVKQLADRHYGEISTDIADQGRELLEAHIKARGLSL